MKRLRSMSSFLVILMIFTIPPSVYAEDVVLNPGYISGSVSLDGYDITSVTVRAIDTNKNFSASVTASISAGAASIDYELTVEGDNDYYVVADVWVQAANNTRVLIPTTGPVTVAIGADVTHDLSMEPAVISGTISTGDAANTITNYQVYAYLTLPEFDQTSNYSFTNAHSLNASGDVGTDYTLLVAPDTLYSYVRAYIGIDGLNYNIYDASVNSPAAGSILARDYTVDVTAATISGVSLLHDIDVTSAYVYGYASQPLPARYSNATIQNVLTGEYSLAVDAGTWLLYPQFRFNLPDADPDLAGLIGWLQLPYSPDIVVPAGEELTYNFNVVPGFIPGTLALWGANTDFDRAEVRALGYPGGGSIYSQVDPDTGKFMFVASPGVWMTDYYQRIFFEYPDNPDTSLWSTVNQSYYNPTDLDTVVEGQTNSSKELSYGTITVLRYFYVADGGTLSSPYIKATRSESPYSTAYGYGSNVPTTEGQAIVTLLLPGDYSLEAFTKVDVSTTEFGTVNITVEEGDVVVIGGTARPTIKVTNPTSGETICGNRVTVEGTATDDVGVASITINGEWVDFVSTGNPDDPFEVGFSHEVTLIPDEANEITVTVADTDGTDPISLSMTVYSDPCGPEEIEVAVDVKPGSCPNPLNVKSKGVLPVAILGTAELDVATVDVNTVNILGVAPVRSDYEDVGTPFYPFFIGKQDGLDCTEAGADGYGDLTLKFDRQQLLEALELSGNPVIDGSVIALPLNGNLLDEFGGTKIVGEDVIVIRSKGN